MIEFAWFNDATLGEGYGDLRSVDADGFATIHAHLEDDHPAMQDAIADGHNPDQAEFLAYVRWDEVRNQSGGQHEGARQMYQAALARVVEREQETRRARVDAIRAEFRSGARRRQFPELDSALRANRR